MRRAFYISTLLIVVIALHGCSKKWLEKKPDNQVIVPDDLEECQHMMDNADLMNNNVFAYGEIGADGHYVSASAWTSGVAAARMAYTWTYTPFSQQANWDHLFFRVFHCNLVLKVLAELDSSGSNKKNWENIRGQALFNRAIVFYGLAQTFGQPYNKAAAASDMGIPMRFTTDITERSIRHSVQDNYYHVMKDALEAAELLPDTPLYATRAGKAAAYALLARCYLDKEQYDDALLYAEKCISIQGRLIDFSKLSAGVPIGSTVNFATPLHNPEIIFFELMYTQHLSGFLSSAWCADRELFDQYETNDYRKTRFFKTVSGGILRFNGNYNSNASLFCGIATDEMYLVQAECLARKGDYNKALDVLNTLLRTRYDNQFMPRRANSGVEALTIILKERRKELVLRNLRWSDLRRLNKDERFRIDTIKREIGGKTYSLEANSYKYSFPIPEDVIAISGMPQTPGWK